MKKVFTLILTILLVFVICISHNCYVEVLASFVSESPKYYLGSVVNTGENNGYSEEKPLELKDPHYGWKLGHFFVSGYTRTTKDEQGNLVFLKNLGDKVILSFTLEQDINKLNGDDKLSIYEDKNGYDKYFEIEKTNFGRGTLIIKHTDYQNLDKNPTVYTNYLSALTKNANTTVEFCEEGDYEVALNYKIKISNNFLFIPTPSL